MRGSRQQRPAQGSGWTQGSALGVRATSTLLLACALCGPVGVAIAISASQPKPAVAQVAVGDTLTAVEQSAGEYGAAFVAAWLSATRDEPGNLSEYVSESAIRQLSAEPWRYRDLMPVSVDPGEGSDVVSVVVAANVEEYDMTSDDGQSTIWPRRYFAVAVRAGEAGLGVVGLPAPITAPERVTDPLRLVYGQAVTSTSTARATVEAFLNAFLAGSGDITRYVTPGAEIAAITPAPYATLTVTDVKSDVEADDAPRTGAILHVLAVAEVQSPSGQQLTTTYALSLTARDGRWEMTSVDLAPLEDAAGDDPAPQPTSTPSG